MTFTFAGVLTDLARRTPDASAIVLEDTELTFAQLEERGTRLAHVLESIGIDRQQRVGFLGRNSPVFFEVALACSLQDAVLVGLNWRLAPDELSAIIEDAGLALLICGPELRAVVMPVAERLGVPLLSTGEELDARMAAAAADPVVSLTTGTSVLLQLYSSGTTGLPKGTLITNENLSYSQTSGRLLYGMDARSVNLVPSPLFHIGGVGYGTTALSQGGTTVLVPDSDPATLIRAIERHRVTHAFMVPAVIQNLVRSPELADADLSSLAVVAYGGAPMSETLLQSAIAALQCEFLGVYGMTETSGTVVALAAEHHDPGGPRAHLLRSIGRALPWAAEVELRDPVTFAPVEARAVGEIWVRSGQVTPGYWRQPEASEQALTADGWLRTGDAAYADEEGFLYLHDRMKDMVITGGENVYPAEVENVLARHPAVVEVAVIGVPSERWGESVKALVVVDPQVPFDEAELIEFARDRLAHYKCPKAVEVVELLPRNASGKILKKELRMTHGGALA